MLYGARISLTVGIVSQLINTVIGVCLGLSAGLLGRLVGRLRQRPHQPDAGNPVADLRARHHGDPEPGADQPADRARAHQLVLHLPTRARLGAVAEEPGLRPGREGARATGTCGSWRRSSCPTCSGPIIVIGTLGMGGAVLAEAALSFLGLGIRPPFPSWGSMLSDARDQITTAPWISIFPGLAIFVTVLGLNLLGDGLRDILDPQATDAAA